MKTRVLFFLFLLSVNHSSAQFFSNWSNTSDPLSKYSSATGAGILVTGVALLGTLWIVNGVEMSFEAPIATRDFSDNQGNVYRVLPYGGNFNLVYSDPNHWFFMSGIGTIGYGSQFENQPKNTKFYMNGNIGVGCNYPLRVNQDFSLGGTLICSPVFFQEAGLPMPDFFVRMYVEGAYQPGWIKGFVRLGTDQTGAVRLSVGFRTNE